MMRLDSAQRNVLKVYILVLVLGFVYYAMIMMTGHGIPCLFRYVTGMTCPGCGSSRMMMAAFRGDFATAFHYNQAAFIAFPSWILISILVFIGKPQALRNSKVLLGILYVTVFFYLVQFALRNVLGTDI